MSLDELAATLEATYAKFHRQQYRTADDRQDALHTLKGQLREAEQCLRLPPTRDTARARSKLTLWCELVKGTLTEAEGA